MSSDDEGSKGWEGEAPAEPPIEHANHSFPVRKHPVHGVKTDIDGPIVIFDTVCTKNRKPWLATALVHETLQAVWTEATAWLVGRYVIMPDHIHLFAAPGSPEVSLDNWVQYWKSQFTKLYKNQHSEKSLPGRWQTEHWDTRLRSWQSYDQKWKYVRNNPVRHELVSRPDDWPFQGEIHKLRWE